MNAFWSLHLSFEAMKSFIFIQCTKKCISTNVRLVDFPIRLVDVMHHLPTGSLANWTSERFFLSNYVMLLRKAFKLYYYFLGLKIGSEHKSMLFNRTLENYELPRGKKMLFDIFDHLLSRAHIQSIRFTFFVYFELCSNWVWPVFTLVCSISFSIKSKSYFVTKIPARDNC